MELASAAEDRAFERILLLIFKYRIENKEAKASQGGTTENEQKCSILSSIRNIYE